MNCSKLTPEAFNKELLQLLNNPFIIPSPNFCETFMENLDTDDVGNDGDEYQAWSDAFQDAGANGIYKGEDLVHTTNIFQWYEYYEDAESRGVNLQVASEIMDDIAEKLDPNF